jgi:hypothetical protein
MGKFVAIFRLMAQMSGFESTINKAKGAMAGIGSKLGDGLKGQIGKVLSVSNAFTMLKGSMEEVLNRAKQYNNLGKRMGIPAAEVQRLDKAAERAGINMASLQRAMSLVQKFGGEAFGGTAKKAQDVSKQLGLTKEQMLKMREGGTEGLAAIADALVKIEDSGERGAIGMAVFGEKWPEVQNLIEGGGEGIRKMGEGQTRWGVTTQDSLTRVQKAWSNMWNDISVTAAELIELFEPLVGIFRILANVVMILVRLLIYGLINAMDTVRMAVLGLLWVLNKLGSALGFSGADKALKDVEKQMDETATRMEKRKETLKDNLKKDGEGMMKGAAQTIGFATGEEEPFKARVNKPAKDTRTQDEKDAYEQALKGQESARVEAELQNATEEKRISLMREQLYLLRKQEEELRKKHPERFKETKEYLELQKQIAAQMKSISTAQRTEDLRLYAMRVEFTELAGKRRVAIMKDNGETEEAIEEEVMKQKMEKVARLADEMKYTLNDTMATNAERQKKAKELAEAIADTEDDIRKKRAAALASGGSAAVDSLQRMGGGGGVVIGGLAVQTLKAQEQSNKHLAELVEIAKKGGVFAITSGTYSDANINE